MPLRPPPSLTYVALLALLVVNALLGWNFHTLHKGPPDPLQPGNIVPSFVAATEKGDTVISFPDQRDTLLYTYNHPCRQCEVDTKALAIIGEQLCQRYRCMAVSLSRDAPGSYMGLDRHYQIYFSPACDAVGRLLLKRTSMLLHISRAGYVKRLWQGSVYHNRTDIERSLKVTLPSEAQR